MSSEYHRRVAKLEKSRSDALIIFFEERATPETSEPLLERAYFGPHALHRNEGETNEAFVARANPHGRPMVTLAADCEGL